jgi:hypothetical protein
MRRLLPLNEQSQPWTEWNDGLALGETVCAWADVAVVGAFTRESGNRARNRHRHGLCLGGRSCRRGCRRGDLNLRARVSFPA